VSQFPRIATRPRQTVVDGLRIYSESAGSGPPLVLLHGLSGSSRWWARNIAPLAQHFEVHTVDLAGFGRSRGAGPFQLAAAAAQMAGWMEQIGIERAAVAGHSMGGLVAAELAADHPQRVERLVLVAAALPALRLAPFETPADLIRGLPYLPFSFLELLLPDLIRAGVPTVVSALAELLSADIRGKLTQITAPTLLVWGDCDPLVPLRQAWQLARLVPCHELAIFKHVGHNPMWERPESFNQLLVEFLAQNTPACAAPPALRLLPPTQRMRLAA
jgi:pimeloyl-ACP methyl ester carboxylesterase